jgi:hypothetical protein
MGMTSMKRYLIAPLLLTVLACPRDKKDRAEGIPVDSSTVAMGATLDTNAAARDSVDLSTVRSNIPAAAPDTFKERELRAPAPRSTATGGGAGDVEGAALPSAPDALLETVQREEAVSRFCFTEFGKKTDPTLRGNVVMIVTVGGSGINDARVGNSRWSGTAGTAVNRCLNERAERAWRLSPGAVKSGRYAVRLSFTS